MSQSKNDTESGSNWTVVESPTEKSLHGVVQTKNGPYIVGAEGDILARTDGSWHLVVDDGPAAANNTLRAVAVTSDRKRLWFAGDSGALGMYDVETGKKYDYSAPKEKTSTWEAITVTGDANSERVWIANGSGEVLSVTTDENGCPQWGEVVKPGSGSTLAALDFGKENCYGVDTNGNAFSEAGDGWKDMGVKNAQVNFFDLCASPDELFIASGDGMLYRYDRKCKNWTPVSVGETALYALDHADDTIVAVAASGHVAERIPEQGWTQVSSPTEEDLSAVALGNPDVAVGAGGTIIER